MIYHCRSFRADRYLILYYVDNVCLMASEWHLNDTALLAHMLAGRDQNRIMQMLHNISYGRHCRKHRI